MSGVSPVAISMGVFHSRVALARCVKRLSNGTAPVLSETDTVKTGTGTVKKGHPKVKPK